MKKSVMSVIASAAASIILLSTASAVSATDYYYDGTRTTPTQTSGVYYDNTEYYYDNGSVYYDNNQNQDSNVQIVYVIPTGSNTTTYYDGDGYYINNTNRKVKIVKTSSNKTYPQLTVDTKQSSVTYTFLSDAEYATGIVFDNLPIDVVYNLPNRKYTVIDSNIIQVKYYDKEGNAVAIRKGCGKAEVSGDRTHYDVKKTSKINNTNVTCYGYTYEFGKEFIDSYYLATFYYDGYSYSIKSNLPMTLSELQDIAKDMM